MSWFKKALSILCVVIAVVALVVLCCIGIGWLAGAGIISASGWLATAASTVVSFATGTFAACGLTLCTYHLGWVCFWAVVAALAIGYMVAPEEMDETISTVTSALGRGVHSVAKFVGDVAGSVANGLAGGLFSSTAGKWLIAAACVVGGYFLLKSDDNDAKTVVIERTQA